jgi:hypothetical protein
MPRYCGEQTQAIILSDELRERQASDLAVKSHLNASLKAAVSLFAEVPASCRSFWPSWRIGPG